MQLYMQTQTHTLGRFRRGVAATAAVHPSPPPSLCQSFIHSVHASVTRCFTVCTSLISLVTVDTGIPVKVLYVTELRKLGS